MCVCDIHTCVQMSVLVHACGCSIGTLDVLVYNSLPHSFDRVSELLNSSDSLSLFRALGLQGHVWPCPAFYTGVEAQPQVFMFMEQSSYPKSSLQLQIHSFFFILASLHNVKFLLQQESLFIIHQFYNFNHEHSNQYSFFQHKNGILYHLRIVCLKTNSHLVPKKSHLENVLN